MVLASVAAVPAAPAVASGAAASFPPVKQIRAGVLVPAGLDRGSRTAGIVAVLRPERCKALVSVSGYHVTDREAKLKPLAPQAELAWWYP